MTRRIRVYEKVKAHCDLMGVTAAELARRTGMHELRAQRLLNGSTRLLAEDLEAISKALDKSISELCGEEARAS